MSDVIDRQMVIDELVRWGKVLKYSIGEKNLIACIIGMISAFPPAEQDGIKKDMQIGDEIAFHHDERPDTVVVITHIGKDGFVDGIDAKGTLYARKNPERWTKTGRHFPEMEILLKKMLEG